MGETAKTVQVPLRKGLPAEVLNAENKLIFRGKVENFGKGSVTLKDARGRSLPVGVYGMEVKLRFEYSEYNVISTGKVARSNAEQWKIEELEQKTLAPKREFFRQPVETGAQVICVRCSPVEPQLRRGQYWTHCRIADVSVGGFRLISSEPFQPGDFLTVQGMRLVEGGRSFTFMCRVRRVRHDGSLRECGCQIEGVSAKEQALLEEAIFQLQREEIQRRKERGR